MREKRRWENMDCNLRSKESVSELRDGKRKKIGGEEGNSLN